MEDSQSHLIRQMKAETLKRIKREVKLLRLGETAKTPELIKGI